MALSGPPTPSGAYCDLPEDELYSLVENVVVNINGTRAWKDMAERAHQSITSR